MALWWVQATADQPHLRLPPAAIEHRVRTREGFLLDHLGRGLGASPVGASLMVGGDTYDSGEEGEADRNLLLVPLNASDRALRRDECGAWRITGKFGSIHIWGDGQTESPPLV